MGATAEPRRLLGQVLIEMELISEDQLEQALEAQRATGQFLGEILIARGWITRRAVGDALRVQRGLWSEPAPGLGGRLETRETTRSTVTVDDRLPSAWLGQRRPG